MKPGSIVKLKSGGPSMTVRWIDDGDAYCEWFSEVKGAHENKGASFPLTSLEVLQA
ncbi:DUF2158 domain-containing protein [Ensifer sp. LC163]|uniref:YodC family protein n=1 Tax=Ensifer sp. LC163 TaxID=1120652 RepID=UPI0009F1A65C